MAARQLRWHEIRRRRKSESGQKFLPPPTPFLFARSSVKVFQNSASGFSRKKVRISFRERSQVVCCEFIASALRAEAGRLYSICQDFLGSIATFCESKTRFAVAKQRANYSRRGFLFFGKQSMAARVSGPGAIVSPAWGSTKRKSSPM